MTKEAKIIAMTCTHAALARRDLIEMGFSYDNVVMEEAAQVILVDFFVLCFFNRRCFPNRSWKSKLLFRCCCKNNKTAAAA
jgi:hypothetical protein